MIALLLRAKKLLASCGGKPAKLCEMQRFQQQYDEILELGRLEFLRDEASDYNGEDMKLLRRLKHYKTEHLRFLSDPSVPFEKKFGNRLTFRSRWTMIISAAKFGVDAGWSSPAARWAHNP